MLEDFGLPALGETALIAGALLGSQGIFHIVPLLVVAWSAAVIGDNIGYLIGRFGGRFLVLRYGHYFFITRNRLADAEQFFRRYGQAVVVVARFFPVLRQLNGLVAGTANMPWSSFLRYNAIGATLWVGVWGTLFYFLGQSETHWGDILLIFLLAGLIFGLTGLGLYRRQRPKK